MNAEKQEKIFEAVTDEDWQNLAKELNTESARICMDNECTEEEHNCESYAYIAADGTLSSICYPDYWQGWGSGDEEQHGTIAAIPLPFYGSGPELKEQVNQELRWDF